MTRLYSVFAVALCLMFVSLSGVEAAFAQDGGVVMLPRSLRGIDGSRIVDELRGPVADRRLTLTIDGEKVEFDDATLEVHHTLKKECLGSTPAWQLDAVGALGTKIIGIEAAGNISHNASGYTQRAKFTVSGIGTSEGDFQGILTIRVQYLTQSPQEYKVHFSYSILPQPVQPNIEINGASFVDGSFFCTGSLLNLAATNSGSYDVAWAVDPVDDPIVYDPMQESWKATLLPNKPGLHTIIVRASAGQCAAEVIRTIEVVAPPVVAITKPSSPFVTCEGDMLELEGTITAGEDGVQAGWFWKPDAQVGTLETLQKDVAKSFNTTIAAASVDAGKEERSLLLVAKAKTCAEVSQELKLEIYDRPIAEIVAEDGSVLDEKICVEKGRGMTLRAKSLPAHGKASWTVGGPATLSSGEGETTVVTVTGDGAVTVTLTVQNTIAGAPNCLATHQKTFYSNPAFDVELDHPQVCTGTMVTVSAKNANPTGGTFKYFLDGVSQTSNAFTVQHLGGEEIDAQEVKVVYELPASLGGCKNEKTVSLSVAQKALKPSLSMNPPSGRYCHDGAGVTISTTTQGGGSLQYTYSLTPTGTAVSVNGTGSQVDFLPVKASADPWSQAYKAKADIEGYTGCESEESDPVTVVQLGRIVANGTPTYSGPDAICAESTQRGSWVNMELNIAGLQVVDGTSLPMEGVWVHVAPDGVETLVGSWVDYTSGALNWTMGGLPLSAESKPGEHTFYYKVRFKDGAEVHCEQKIENEKFKINLTPAIESNVVTFSGTNGDNYLCFGATAALDGNAIDPIKSYSWTRDGAVIPGAEGEDLQITQAGAYVRVAKAGECTLSSTPVNVSLNPEFAVSSVDKMNPLCSDGADGSITVVVDTSKPGTQPYTYSLNSGTSALLPTGGVIGGLANGTYEVRLLDQRGCSAVGINNPVVLDTKPLAFQGDIEVENIGCKGEKTGTLKFSWDGGTPANGPTNYKLELLSGATVVASIELPGSTHKFTGLSAGKYVARLSLGGKCTVESSEVEITEPASGPSIVDKQVVLPCKAGEANGQVWIAVTGGQAPYRYAAGLTPPLDVVAGQEIAEGNTLTKVATGTGGASVVYHILVKDGNGCSATASVALGDGFDRNAILSAVPPTCFGERDGGIEITNKANYVGDDPDLQLVSSPFTTPAVDDAGWKKQQSGSGGQKFLLGYGVDTYHLFYKVPRTYFQSAVATGEYCIVQHPDPIVVTSIEDLKFDKTKVIISPDAGCQGENKGSIELQSGVFAGKTTGAYTHFKINVELFKVGVLVPEQSIQDQGFSSSSLSTFSGKFEGLSAGRYTLKVTFDYQSQFPYAPKGPDFSAGEYRGDLTRCEQVLEGEYVVEAPNDFTLELVDLVAPKCPSDAQGTATIKAKDGAITGTTAPYEWNNAPYTVDATNAPTSVVYSGLPAGITTVLTVKRGDCTRTIDVVMPPAPEALAIDILALTHENGCGAKGTIKVAARGGTSPYTYKMGTSSSGPFPSVLADGYASDLNAGKYFIQVEDGKGCTSSAFSGIEIRKTEKPVVAATISEATCEIPSRVEVALTGGARPVTIRLTDANGVAIEKILEAENQQVFEGLAGTVAGMQYRVVATDATGCTSDEVNFTLHAPSTIVPEISNVKEDMLCPGATGEHTGGATLTITGINGTATYKVLRDDVEIPELAGEYTVPVEFTALVAGSYRVEVIDGSNCKNSVLFSIVGRKPFRLSTYGVKIPSSATASDGEFFATVAYLDNTPVSGVVQYAIAPVAGAEMQNTPTPNDSKFHSLPPAVYTVTATLGGCSMQAEVDLNLLKVTYTVVHLSCNPAEKGRVNLRVENAMQPVSIAWEDEQGNALDASKIESGGYRLVNLEQGLYRVRVTDARGLTVEKSIRVLPYQKPTFSLAAVAPTCQGGNDGKILVTLLDAGSVSAGQLVAKIATPPTQVEFDVAQRATFTTLASGVYSVLLADAKGCESESLDIEVPKASPVSFIYSLSDVVCGGTSKVNPVELRGVVALAVDVKYSVTTAIPPLTDAAITKSPQGKWTLFTGAPLTVNQGVDHAFAFSYTVAGVTCSYTETVNVPCVKVEEVMPIACHGGEAKYKFTLPDEASDVKCTPDGGNPVELTPDASHIVECNLLAGRYTLTWQKAGNGQSYSFVVAQPDRLTLTHTVISESCGKGQYEITVTGGTITLPLTVGSTYYRHSKSPLSADQLAGMPADFGVYDGTKVAGTIDLNFENGNNTLYVYDNNACEAIFEPHLEDPYSEKRFELTQPGCPANATLAGAGSEASLIIEYGKAVQVDIRYVGTPQQGWFGPVAANTPAELLGRIFKTSPILPGQYTYTVSLPDGTCPMTRSFEIVENTAPSFTLAFTVDGTLQGRWCDDDYGYNGIQAQVTGGTAPYTYIWTVPNVPEAALGNPLTPNAVQGNVNYLKPGDYTLVVRDDKGCEYREMYTLPGVNPLTIKASNVSVASCYDAEGKESKADVEATGGLPFDDTHYMFYIGAAESTGNAFDPSKATERLDVGTPKSITGFTDSKATLFVADRVGCHATVDLAEGVIFPKDYELTTLGVYNAVCADQESGTIHVEVAGTPNIRYILLDNEENVVESRMDGVFGNLKAGSYKVLVLDDNGCQKTFTDFLVGAPAPIAVAYTLEGDTPKCPGDFIERISSAVSGGTPPYINYAWTVTPLESAAPTIVVTEDAQFPQALPGTYILTVTDSQGCESSSMGVQVEGPAPYRFDPLTVVSAPCRTLAADGGLSLGALTLGAVKGGNTITSMVWKSTVVQSDEGQNVEVGKEYKLPHGLYSIEIRDDRNCVHVEDIEVPYIEGNSVKFDFLDHKPLVCYGERVVGIGLTVREGTEDTSKPREWSIIHDINTDLAKEGLLISEFKGLWRAASPIYGLTKISAAVYSMAGCKDTASYFVDVHPTLNLTFDRLNSRVGILYDAKTIDRRRAPKDTDPPVYKDSIILGVLADVPSEVAFHVTNTQGTPYNYLFAPQEFFASSASGLPNNYTLMLPADVMTSPAYQKDIVKMLEGDKAYTFVKTTVSVKNDQNGCAEDLELYIRIIDELRIPNVFTPNGDGVNDRWLHNGDAKYANLFTRLRDLLPNMQVEVFTRAGVRVWKAEGDKIAEGWDGTNGGKGGPPLPVGTYYYVIRFNVENSGNAWKPLSGSVTIVR